MPKFKFGSFIAPKGKSIEIKVDDDVKTVVMYPVSVRRLGSLREMAKSAAGAITTLFTDNYVRDLMRTTETAADGSSRTSTEAPTTDLIELRARQRDAAVASLANLALADENLLVIAGLIVDSMRDAYTAEQRNDPATAAELLEEVPLPVFFQLAKGVASANGELFTPLADALAAKFPAGLRINKKGEDEGESENRKQKQDDGS